MDLLSIIELGSFCVVSALGGVSLALLLAKNYLLGQVSGAIEGFLLGFLGQLNENPEVSENLLKSVKPFIDKVIATYTKDFKEKSGGAIGTGMLGMAIPFVPKKFQGLAQIALGFMQNQQSGSNQDQNPQQGNNSNANKSPFSK